MNEAFPTKPSNFQRHQGLTMIPIGLQIAPAPGKPKEAGERSHSPENVAKQSLLKRSVRNILSRNPSSPQANATSGGSNDSSSSSSSLPQPRQPSAPNTTGGRKSALRNSSALGSGTSSSRPRPVRSPTSPPSSPLRTAAQSKSIASNERGFRHSRSTSLPSNSVSGQTKDSYAAYTSTPPRTSADSASRVDAGSFGFSPVPSTFSTSASRLRKMSLQDGNSIIAGTPALSRGEATREMARAEQEAGSRSAGAGPQSAGPSPSNAQQTPASTAAGVATPPNTATTLSGLVCNVYRTTGREPHPLVGATTTILGDTLFVFGGRILSRTRPQLTADLYALDLISRHWTKVDMKGDIPAPRYFHSVCALGDTKLVCYGGMSPSTQPSGAPQSASQMANPDQQPEVVVMSDIHIYDVPTRTWTYVPTVDPPQGRYAHCATILNSSAVFASANAPLTAIHHNPSTGNPNQGSIGVTLDGTGGAEMVVVGGQDSANHYIEQISVFNLRSLKWTVTSPLGKSCGAYRSVVAPLMGMAASRIGKGATRKGEEKYSDKDASESASSMLIYSNYNFLDVKLELQVRMPDGTLSEKHMHGHFNPPGLRFPNGGVIDGHFVVSGTYLTSSKQEYALWALDLKTLTWSRIDAGGSVFSQGSWNRGLLWNRRNTFVILGNQKRSLVEDYNHRRINFTNLCMVELEAFGLYDNPRRMWPLSGYVSVSAPAEGFVVAPPVHQKGLKQGWTGGGRPISTAAEELGRMAMGLRELADMDLLAFGGERLPVSSRIIARRWGPYFVQLLRDGAANQDGDTATLRPLPQRGESQMSHASSVTITPTITNSSISSGSTLTGSSSMASGKAQKDPLRPPTPHGLPPTNRPRTLYLPHTYLTLQSLVHYLYTSTLPPPNHPLCTPQILCSLLQLARPYQIDGLLEAVVERLHQVLDGRNAAAVFNAAAMAAGGGRGVGFAGGWGAPGQPPPNMSGSLGMLSSSAASSTDNVSGDDGLAGKTKALRINTSVAATHGNARNTDDETSSASTGGGGSSATGSEYGYSDAGGEGSGREAWTGEMSAVVGLQKRGLRGLMEGRKLRERGRSAGQSQGQAQGGPAVAAAAAAATAATAAAAGQGVGVAASGGAGVGGVGLGIV